MAALELEGQPLVIDPQAIQDGGLDVMHVDWIRNHVVAEVVGGFVRRRRA